MTDTADVHQPGFLSRLEDSYSRVRLLSIDVAVASLGGGVLAVRVISSQPPIAFYLLLPLSVWVVYTLDHLLDARRIGPGAKTPRHRFHYRHAAVLWVLTVLIATLCAIVGAIELSRTGIIFGVIIASLFALHELVVKLAGSRASPWLIKELGVAFIFTAGTWGLPILRYHSTTTRWAGWPIEILLQYFLLAGVNLVEFSIFESRIDALDGQTSFVQYVGRDRGRKIALAMLAVQIPLAAFALVFNPNDVVIGTELIYAAMAAGLWSLLGFSNFAAKRERYRAIGDAVFLLPLVAAFLKTDSSMASYQTAVIVPALVPVIFAFFNG